MRAATILALINAAREVEDAYYSKSRSSTQKALAWNDLALARNALEAEIGTLNITIESATPPSGTSSPGGDGAAGKGGQP